MLFESRTYTFLPGTLNTFWNAQVTRGLDPTSRPIMARVIGYFYTVTGDQDQITHLWRFDDFDDWRDRLFFKHPDAEPYYKIVRPLMLKQDNSFLLPSPLDELNPLWKKGRDWLPGDSTLVDITSCPSLLVEELKFQLFPGCLNSFWQAFTNNSLLNESLFRERLFACFYTLVGQQHEVVIYRWHENFEKNTNFNNALAESNSWISFLLEIREFIVKLQTRLLKPAPLPLLSPLFNKKED
jgi:hypothetical protein